MKALAAALAVLALAALGIKSRLDQSRTLLLGQQREIRQAYDPVVEALRQRAVILPELERGMSEATATQARTAAKAMEAAKSRQDLIEACSAIDDAVGRWLVEAEESAPRPGVEEFKERLRETEIRFAQARAKYNATVQRYNISLELFPNNIVARREAFVRDEGYFVTQLKPKPR